MVLELSVFSCLNFLVFVLWTLPVLCFHVCVCSLFPVNFQCTFFVSYRFLNFWIFGFWTSRVFINELCDTQNLFLEHVLYTKTYKKRERGRSYNQNTLNERTHTVHTSAHSRTHILYARAHTMNAHMPSVGWRGCCNSLGLAIEYKAATPG